MPQTVAEADVAYAADWTKWPVPVMPEIPAGEGPWADRSDNFWNKRIDVLPVDPVRTAALATVDVPIHTQGGGTPWQGSTYGMPFHIIDASKMGRTKVWDLSRGVTWNWFTPTFPTTDTPLPDVVRREGDPAGYSDQGAMLWDPTAKKLWEMPQLQHSSWNFLKTFGQCDWVCGYAGASPSPCVWDTTKPWNAPGQPNGIVASRQPLLPMVIRYEEIKRGVINHAVHGGFANYSPQVVGSARGSDGSAASSPLRSGEILRLKPSVLSRFNPGTPERIIATALYQYGIIVGDKTSGTTSPTAGPGSFPVTMDRRWATGDAGIPPLNFNGGNIRLTDFEVIAQ